MIIDGPEISRYYTYGHVDRGYSGLEQDDDNDRVAVRGVASGISLSLSRLLLGL